MKKMSIEEFYKSFKEEEKGFYRRHFLLKKGFDEIIVGNIKFLIMYTLPAFLLTYCVYDGLKKIKKNKKIYSGFNKEEKEKIDILIEKTEYLRILMDGVLHECENMTKIF